MIAEDIVALLKRRIMELSKDRIMSAASKKARISEIERTIKLINSGKAPITERPTPDGYTQFLQNN